MENFSDFGVFCNRMTKGIKKPLKARGSLTIFTPLFQVSVVRIVVAPPPPQGNREGSFSGNTGKQ